MARASFRAATYLLRAKNTWIAGTRPGHDEDRMRMTTTLVQLLAALHHRFEERRRFAVEEFHVGGNRPARRGVTGHRARTDRHHLDAGDILAGLLRLEFRIEQVLGAGEDQ